MCIFYHVEHWNRSQEGQSEFLSTFWPAHYSFRSFPHIAPLSFTGAEPVKAEEWPLCPESGQLSKALEASWIPAMPVWVQPTGHKEYEEWVSKLFVIIQSVSFGKK